MAKIASSASTKPNARSTPVAGGGDSASVTSAGFGTVDRAIERGQQQEHARLNAPSHGHFHPTPDSLMMAADSVLRTRELYWHNVVREMLNSLSIMCQGKPELFDGRFAILTRSSERIAIGRIFPLFACSIPNSPWEVEASMAVQCTVYRIITPEGEVFTLPLHEIRAIHSLTPELVEQLQKEAEAQSAGEEDIEGDSETSTRPFGLAAFTSLPRPAPPFGPRGPEGVADAAP